ncbi:hypothetical protein M5K25_002208 [Dendrobium thyrsiflorum]|uniref:NET domain-containing protein n=1 Tax=Dendrobium thyrsiflorum TaxID=117978 RepID=A0ABD0VTS1_DENTH
MTVVESVNHPPLPQWIVAVLTIIFKILPVRSAMTLKIFKGMLKLVKICRNVQLSYKQSLTRWSKILRSLLISSFPSAVIGLPLFGSSKEDSLGLPRCSGDGLKWDPIPTKLMDVSALFFEDQGLFLVGLKGEEISSTGAVEAEKFMCIHMGAELDFEAKVVFMESCRSSLSKDFSAKGKAVLPCKELNLLGPIEDLSRISVKVATRVDILSVKVITTMMSIKRPMSSAEKEQLGRQMKKLPEKAFDRAVEIVLRNKPSEAEPSEVFVDLETQDNITLWRLYYYVQTVLEANKQSNRSPIPFPLM